jgi:hypothetical protein
MLRIQAALHRMDLQTSANSASTWTENKVTVVLHQV